LISSPWCGCVAGQSRLDPLRKLEVEVSETEGEVSDTDESDSSTYDSEWDQVRLLVAPRCSPSAWVGAQEGKAPTGPSAAAGAVVSAAFAQEPLALSAHAHAVFNACG